MTAKSVSSTELFDIALDLFDKLSASPTGEISLRQFTQECDWDITPRVAAKAAELIETYYDIDGCPQLAIGTDGDYDDEGNVTQEATTAYFFNRDIGVLRLSGPETIVLDHLLSSSDLDELTKEHLRLALGVHEHGFTDEQDAENLIDTDADKGPCFAIIQNATERGQRISFEYRGNTRTVDPLSIEKNGTQFYLTGFDLDRQAVRTFKTALVFACKRTGKPVDHHLEVPPLDESIRSRGEMVHISVSTERLPALAWPGIDITDEVDPDDPSRTIVIVAVTQKPWFFSRVLAEAGHIKILDKDVAQEFCAWARALKVAN